MFFAWESRLMLIWLLHAICSPESRCGDLLNRIYTANVTIYHLPIATPSDTHNNTFVYTAGKTLPQILPIIYFPLAQTFLSWLVVLLAGQRNHSSSNKSAAEWKPTPAKHLVILLPSTMSEYVTGWENWAATADGSETETLSCLLVVTHMPTLWLHGAVFLVLFMYLPSCPWIARMHCCYLPFPTKSSEIARRHLNF